jgi:tetratricopeptide (TPR) repeat protein
MHADPSDSYAPYLLGRALQAAGEHEKAAKTLLLAGKTDPWFDDPWAEAIAAHRADLAVHVEGVKGLIAAKNLAASLTRIEQLLAVYGPRRNLSLMRINILMRQNNRQLGVAATKELLRAYPEWAPAHLRMATILRSTRTRANIELAMGYARTATTLAPGSAEAWFTLASLAASLREYLDAKHAFRRCIALVPNQPAYRGGLIDMLIASGELNDAADAIEAQESLFGLSLETKLLRVRWLHASGRATEAHTLFEECRRAAPGHPAIEGIGRLIGGTP